MNQSEIFDQVVTILRPFVKKPDALANVSMETSILRDLKLNSARLIDIVLEMEETFGVQIKDHQADKVKTVGDAVNLVIGLKAA